MRLTGAQKRALEALAADGGFVDYKRVMKRRDTRIALNNAGLTEPKRELDGNIILWHMVLITDKGHTVLGSKP